MIQDVNKKTKEQMKDWAKNVLENLSKQINFKEWRHERYSVGRNLSL